MTLFSTKKIRPAMNSPTAVKKIVEPEKTELTSIMAANTQKKYAAPMKNTRAVSMISPCVCSPRFAHTLHVESAIAKRGVINPTSVIPAKAGIHLLQCSESSGIEDLIVRRSAFSILTNNANGLLIVAVRLHPSAAAMGSRSHDSRDEFEDESECYCGM